MYFVYFRRREKYTEYTSSVHAKLCVDQALGLSRWTIGLIIIILLIQTPSSHKTYFQQYVQSKNVAIDRIGEASDETGGAEFLAVHHFTCHATAPFSSFHIDRLINQPILFCFRPSSHSPNHSTNPH